MTLVALLGMALPAPQLVVAPYVQPGNYASLRKEGAEIVWVARKEAAYLVRFRSPQGAWRSVAPSRASAPGVGVLYRAKLDDLPLNSRIEYVVTAGAIVGKGTFQTRRSGDQLTFVSIGDSGAGSAAQRALGDRMLGSGARSLVHTGDFVYSRGSGKEYVSHLFSAWAKLMAAIPIYVAPGNHDVLSSDLDREPSGLGYFHYLSLPLNGPQPAKYVRAKGKPSAIDAFRKAADGRYPRMLNYSFDDGPVHFLMLDGSFYVQPFDAGLLRWIKQDLAQSRARWKVVAVHEAPFNGTPKHGDEQWVRSLAPLFEAGGVDLVLSGHVHNYQRSRPLRFKPGKARGTIVDGSFTLDTAFDGKNRTRPSGIVYIVNGGGGESLYDRDRDGRPVQSYTAVVRSNTFSYSLVKISGSSLRFTQIDQAGRTIDAFRIDKSGR